MSNVTTHPEPPQGAQAKQAGDQAPATTLVSTVNIDDLIVGTTLHAPIRDTNGVLLLAAGAIITTEKMINVKSRGIHRVLVSAEDLANTRHGANSTQAEDHPNADTTVDDDRTVDRLESIVGAGTSMLGVKNTGPALSKAVVRHGCKPYDAKQREKLVGQIEKVSESLEGLVEEVLQGKEVDGKQIGHSATQFIDSLISDPDSALSVVNEIFGDATLTKHSLDTAVLAMAIGVEVGLDEENVGNIGICGLVQDLGMTKVPENIRNMNRRLTNVEQLAIHKHPSQTIKLLGQIPGLPNVVHAVVYQIHERPDGSGYPRRLTGKHIHLFARILHVADAYLAMISKRPHRPSLMPYAAMECLLHQAQLLKVDPEIVRCLLNVLSLFPIGSYVALSDQSIARVVRSNNTDYAKPIVVLVQDKEGNPVDSGEDAPLIDLSASELNVVFAVPGPGQQGMGFSEEIMHLHA